MKSILLFVILILIISLHAEINAQSNPQVIDTSISISRIMTVRNGVIRVALDPVSHHLFYVQTGGNIYEVIQPVVGLAYDSLVDSTAHHSVEYVQSLAFHDSTLYISGNNRSDSSLTAGIIVRGKLMNDGSRVWDTLMITEYYQTAEYFDHLFSGLTLSPSGDTIYVCSGARGDHGEIQTRYGAYPGLRNVPLTSNIFSFPTRDSIVIVLPNDSAALAASGYVFSRGVRNHFDLAFDSHGNLFGVENSGDRDHNEEMNWLRRDHHYGFPWKMGDTDNPQQFGTFNPATDKLINHFSRSWRQGFFSNDPAFPLPPAGISFDSPIQNFGPDCDKYRDTSGAVLDASDSSISMGTFTAHRSPLGLVFDNAHVLSPLYNGDAFMLSWTKGYDSCGCSTPPDTSIGPFVDPSQDLVHLDMSFDSSAGNFRLNATRIISDFEHPVDAEIDSNKIYVIENGYGGTSGLYEVTFPIAPIALPCDTVGYVYDPICFPGFTYVTIPPFGTVPNDYYWYNSSGVLLYSDTNLTNGDSIANLPSGFYYVVMNDNGSCPVDTFSFNIFEYLNVVIDSVSHTTCIGCNDGIIYYTVYGGVPPYSRVVIPLSPPYNSPVDSLMPGPYSVYITDATGCTSSVSLTILEDPTGINLSIERPEISFSPNPASSSTLLHFNLDGAMKFRLLNMNGKEENVSAINVGKNDWLISVEGLSNGCYIMEARSNNNKAYLKLVVLHN